MGQIKNIKLHIVTDIKSKVTMSSEKLNQALGHVKEAEKALKTGLFKWSPDHDTAASEYTKAATCFKLAKSLDKCKDAYLKAAEMQEKLGSLFHSAKLLTQAAGVSSDSGEMEEAVDLMEKASMLYREHGSPDTAAATMSKAAKMCESCLPARSVDMYVKAADLCEDDEKLRDATTYLNRAACIEIREKRFIQAVNILKRQLELIKTIGNTMVGYRIVLILIITLLAEEDTVAAEKAFKGGFELSGFGESEEALHCENFIKTFVEGDSELLKQTKSHPTVTHLDTEYARLAKTLTIAEHGLDSAPETHSADTIPQNDISNVTDDPDDEWGDGLC